MKLSISKSMTNWILSQPLTVENRVSLWIPEVV